MREIVLDTETTGFDPFTGDRIVEIGALEKIVDNEINYEFSGQGSPGTE